MISVDICPFENERISACINDGIKNRDPLIGCGLSFPGFDFGLAANIDLLMPDLYYLVVEAWVHHRPIDTCHYHRQRNWGHTNLARRHLYPHRLGGSAAYHACYLGLGLHPDGNQFAIEG